MRSTTPANQLESNGNGSRSQHLNDLNGVQRVATANNGGAAPGLPEREVRDLAKLYVDHAADRVAEAGGIGLDREKLDAGLREVLRERCLPEHVETEFTRVMAAVFRV